MTHTKKIVFHSLLETLCNKQSENKKSLKIFKSAFFSAKNTHLNLKLSCLGRDKISNILLENFSGLNLFITNTKPASPAGKKSSHIHLKPG